MRISQVGAIALVILAASLACAGADEPLIPDSQKVRLNLYVADMAEVASDDDINLTLNEMIATGSTTIRAIANFDFDLHMARASRCPSPVPYCCWPAALARWQSSASAAALDWGFI